VILNLQFVLFVFMFVYVFLFIVIVAQLFYFNNQLQVLQRLERINLNLSARKKGLSLQVKLQQLWKNHIVFYAYSYIVAIAALMVFLSGYSSGKLLLMIAIYLIGLFFVKLLFEFNEQNLRRHLIDQFPNVIDILANHVAVSNSLLDAIKTAADHASGLLKQELMLLWNKMSLGAAPTEAIFETAKKYNAIEFYYFSIIVGIHLKTGAHIVQLLHDMADILRERRYTLMKVRALFAQVKMSGIIIAIVPPAFVILISAVRPDYWMPYFNNPLAQKILFICFALELLGIFMLRKLSKVNI
jgi:tight adherence protein B